MSSIVSSAPKVPCNKYPSGNFILTFDLVWFGDFISFSNSWKRLFVNLLFLSYSPKNLSTEVCPSATSSFSSVSLIVLSLSISYWSKLNSNSFRFVWLLDVVFIIFTFLSAYLPSRVFYLLLFSSSIIWLTLVGSYLSSSPEEPGGLEYFSPVLRIFWDFVGSKVTGTLT